MQIHVLRHADFESAGAIVDWAAERGHSLSESFALTEEYPDPDSIDLLVVMGGPMSADEEDLHPWLIAEKAYLRRAVDSGLPVLAICLGSQLLAEVLGGELVHMERREIGWYPVRLTPEGVLDPLFTDLPDELIAGHWHGDNFTTPPGAPSLLSSAACPNQAFRVGSAVGLQCHLEWTAEDVEALLDFGGDDLSGRDWESTAEEFRSWAGIHMAPANAALFGLLDRMTGDVR